MCVCVCVCVILCNLSRPCAEPVITLLACTHTHTHTHTQHGHRMCLTIAHVKEISAKHKYHTLHKAKVTHTHTYIPTILQVARYVSLSLCAEQNCTYCNTHTHTHTHTHTVMAVNNCCGGQTDTVGRLSSRWLIFS